MKPKPAWDFPIEILVWQRAMRFQYVFALAARELLAASEQHELHASSEGLTIRGPNEDALAPPVQTLRDVYGDRLEVGAPKVRLWQGAQVQEPIMELRIATPRPVLPAVEQELRRRQVPIAERHIARRNALVKGEAPLARLIGLPAQLRKLTDHTAKHWITLSHYAVVQPDPPGGLAA